VGVPGELAGLEALSRRFGKKPLSQVAEPAVVLAESGFLVGPHLESQMLQSGQKIATGSELALALAAPARQVPGYRAKRPDLAKTLRAFGTEGARVLYTGPIADKMVAAVNAAGGQMSLTDLAAYQPKERTPLVREIDGRTIVTMPAPSAGGLMLLEVLSIYGAKPSSTLFGMGFGSSAYDHMVAEAMRGALSDRFHFAGDPAFEPNVQSAYERALSPENIAARRNAIAMNKTHAPADFRTREGGTTHILVADSEGNVASLTTTVNSAFGSGIVVPGAGFVLNDEMDDFSGANEARVFAINGKGPNAPRGGARPVSSMTPTLVYEQGRPILAVGGSGGPRIATGVTQAVLARLIFGHDPTAAVSAPRLHIAPNGGISLESDTPEDVRRGLEAKGETWAIDPPGSAPSVHMIAIEKDALGRPKFLAGADPRKHGSAFAR
jgi:gamma-glutamyltranspeptidase / glutathione hydrolase